MKGQGNWWKHWAQKDVFPVSLEGMWEVKRQNPLMRLFHPQCEAELEGIPYGSDESKIECLTNNVVWVMFRGKKCRFDMEFVEWDGACRHMSSTAFGKPSWSQSLERKDLHFSVQHDIQGPVLSSHCVLVASSAMENPPQFMVTWPPPLLKDKTMADF